NVRTAERANCRKPVDPADLAYDCGHARALLAVEVLRRRLGRVRLRAQEGGRPETPGLAVPEWAHRDDSRSAAVEEDASHPAASRYVERRPGMSHERSLSPAISSRRTRSASLMPRCLAKKRTWPRSCSRKPRSNSRRQLPPPTCVTSA